MTVPLDLEPSGGAQAILEALEQHDVRYVLVGGLAAQTRGWRGATLDVDITPAADRGNLERLAAALTELDAGFRVDADRYPAGYRPRHGLDADTFRGQVSLAFITRHGPLDVALIPDGTRGFDDLRRGADHAGGSRHHGPRARRLRRRHRALQERRQPAEGPGATPGDDRRLRARTAADKSARTLGARARRP